jgi:sulfatase maturation enzyme AslB (radical SAM superfamily)
MKEWSDIKKWNPFNSNKLFKHIDRWKEIRRGNNTPSPVLVTIDPINICNLNCHYWCNADFILNKNNSRISNKSLDEIAKFLPRWNTHFNYNQVKEVCIAGGGESLLHNYIGQFIFQLIDNGVGVGVVTNGTEINRHLDALAECTWVGVSVDAGTPELFFRLKQKDYFNKVIKNMESLINYSQSKKTKLSSIGQGSGVSYKYLLHPENVEDIYNAAKIAKEIGCKNFHIRPAGIPWDKLNNGESIFTYSHVQEFGEQLERARQLEDKNFGVFGITHKFDGDLRKSNDFNRCYALFMTAVFMPPTSSGDKFNLGLCCDRRGDSELTIGVKNTDEIIDFWGSQKHWEMFDKINVKKCPRCTYQPHNQLYENAILIDNLTCDSI